MLHPKDGPWGFFPMKLGQLVRDKYEIVRKLGYGTNASIWLAKQQKYAPRLPIEVDPMPITQLAGIVDIDTSRSKFYP